MRLAVTLEQYNEIENELPEGISICYQDNWNYYLETKDSVLIYDELSAAISNLYNITVEEFFASLPARPDVVKLREIGEMVLDNFSNRNIEDGITSDQVKHTLERTKDIESLLRLGSLDTALIELSVLQPDDMSQPFHWVTQARIDTLINDVNINLSEL